MRIEIFRAKDDTKPAKAPYTCNHITTIQTSSDTIVELSPSGTQIAIPTDAHRLDVLNDLNQRSVSYTWNGSEVEIKTYPTTKTKRRFRG